MDGLEDIMLSGISQTEGEKWCIISLLCGIFKKYSKLVQAAENSEESGEEGDQAEVVGAPAVW